MYEFIQLLAPQFDRKAVNEALGGISINRLFLGFI